MTKTGKQIGKVRTAWFCQLKELGFCSKPSFLLCASNLNYCSWMASRDLDDSCGLRAGGEAHWCVSDARVWFLPVPTDTLTFCWWKTHPLAKKGPDKLMAPLSLSEIAPLCHAVKCHGKDRRGKVPSIQAQGNKLMSYKQQNNPALCLWDWKPGSSHPNPGAWGSWANGKSLWHLAAAGLLSLLTSPITLQGNITVRSQELS